MSVGLQKITRTQAKELPINCEGVRIKFDVFLTGGKSALPMQRVHFWQ